MAVPKPVTPPPTTPTGVPKYADYNQYNPFWARYNYGANSQSGNDPSSPYQFTGGQKNYGEQGSSEGQGGHWEMTGGENAMTQWVPDAVQMTVDESKIPDKYKGVWSSGGPETSQHDVYKQDDHKLPPVMWGGKPMGISNFTTVGTDKNKGPDWGAVVGSVRDPKNKDMVMWDPNYGWITPSANLYSKKDQKENQMMGLMQAGLGLGFGAFMPGMIPGIMRSIIGGAQSLGNGADWKSTLLNVAPGIIGAGMGGAGFHLPPALSQALKYAQYAKTGYGLYKGLKG